jgi:hypothetical protein
VSANLKVDKTQISLSFEIEDTYDLELSPPSRSPAYIEGLWNKTCFEFFYNNRQKPEHYTEWNFSPSLDWCCYEFDQYRGAPKKISTIVPKIITTKNGLEIILPAATDFDHFNLTTVLKTKKNETHYFAIKHRKDKADFHFHEVWKKI